MNKKQKQIIKNWRHERNKLMAKKMRLSKIIKELNKENAPPGGWKPKDKV